MRSLFPKAGLREFCGTTPSRAAQRSRRAAPTARACAPSGHRLPRPHLCRPYDVDRLNPHEAP
jgi:hypothetical protein